MDERTYKVEFACRIKSVMPVEATGRIAAINKVRRLFERSPRAYVKREGLLSGSFKIKKVTWDK